MIPTAESIYEYTVRGMGMETSIDMHMPIQNVSRMFSETLNSILLKLKRETVLEEGAEADGLHYAEGTS
jgi:hypothetical protein